MADPLAPIIDDLKAGYGCEDIAVRRNLRLSFVQIMIAALRDMGRLKEIYGSKR
ncbi:MAG: hypothetical protein JXQ91_07595 [Vannielia sp.]|uniref:hypothetical protein n=1 Tax=Vannielia sp. TaxID=2813045 RepID=UPI003B8BDC3F